MNKIKKFLLNKGMYLVAIGCVAVICLVGLYVMQNSQGEGNMPSASQTPISSTQDAQGVVAVPTKKTDATTSSPATTATATATITTTAGNTATQSKPQSTAANTPVITLELPVAGETLTDYAMDKLVYNKTLDEWRTHSGVDIKAELNAEVKAAAKGTVVDAKKDPRLGYLIILEHENGFTTIYANLKEECNVEIGDTVSCGDVLGWVGATAPFEYAEESHLHFEVLLNNQCVNPWLYLP